MDLETLLGLDIRSRNRISYGYFCNAAWGWKGIYSCHRWRWHLGKHRDGEGTRF